MKVSVKKIKWNKGQTENGQAYDYTRIMVEIPVFEGSANEFGFDTLECEYGLADKHVELLQYRGKMPFEAEVEIMPVKKGNKTLHQVMSFKPLTAK